jgi:hypothetical protein
MNPPIDFSKPLHSAVGLFARDQIRSAMEEVSRRHSEFVETTFRDAIVKHLGHMPDNETLRRHGYIYTTKDHVMHLAWLTSAPQIGHTMDPSTIIASVSPPKFYTP